MLQLWRISSYAAQSLRHRRAPAAGAIVVIAIDFGLAPQYPYPRPADPRDAALQRIREFIAAQLGAQRPAGAVSSSALPA